MNCRVDGSSTWTHDCHSLLKWVNRAASSQVLFCRFLPLTRWMSWGWRGFLQRFITMQMSAASSGQSERHSGRCSCLIKESKANETQRRLQCLHCPPRLSQNVYHEASMSLWETLGGWSHSDDVILLFNQPPHLIVYTNTDTVSSPHCSSRDRITVLDFFCVWTSNPQYISHVNISSSHVALFYFHLLKL